MDTGVIKAEHSPPPIPEAYVYAHRNPRLPDSPVKIGSHTGNLKRLWSRYLTYAGTMQEFKVIAVKEKEVRCFERAIQLLLERDGLWIENELFLPGAWEGFDSVVRPFALPRQCILHVFKRAATTTTISHTVPDDEFDVEDLPIMSVELTRRHNTSPPPPPAKKRRTDDDDESLSFSDLIRAVWQYLSDHDLMRDPSNGDIYARAYINAYSFQKQFTASEFITFIYQNHHRLGLSHRPRDAHTGQLRVILRENGSTMSPFLTIARDSIGFIDGILDLPTMGFKTTTDLNNVRVMTHRVSRLTYQSASELTAPHLDAFLETAFEGEMIDRFLFALGHTLQNSRLSVDFTILVDAMGGPQVSIIEAILRSMHETVTFFPSSKQDLTGVVLLDRSTTLKTTLPTLGVITRRTIPRDREVLVPMLRLPPQDLIWPKEESLQLILRAASSYAKRHAVTFSLDSWFKLPWYFSSSQSKYVVTNVRHR